MSTGTPTAETILADLLALVDVVDETPVTMARIRERLPAELYGELRLSFLSAKALAASPDPADRIFADEIADTQAALAGGGFILHTPERLALLDEIAPALSWSADLLAALRRVTVTPTPRWQLDGRPTAPTLETLTAELAAASLAAAARERLARISACRQAFDRVAAELRGRIESGVTDGGQISAAFGSAWSTAWPH